MTICGRCRGMISSWAGSLVSGDAFCLLVRLIDESTLHSARSKRRDMKEENKLHR